MMHVSCLENTSQKIVTLTVIIYGHDAGNVSDEKDREVCI